jgi:hypothetical protein
MSLVYSLGERYLWVDALCIMQDDMEHKMRDIANMDRIYNHASATLVALHGADAAAGLPGLRPNSRPPQLVETLTIDKGSKNLDRSPSSIAVTGEVPQDTQVTANLVATPPPLHMAIDVAPWGTRGWTFQEKVLSTRIILYSNREAQWVCQGMSVCECGSATLTVKDDVLVADREAASTIWRLSQPSVAHRYWTTLVSTYSERSLTVETDRLPALSGIASTIADVSKSTYIAGLWKEDLLQGLFWSRSTPSEVSLPGVYRGPTFSWARVDGPVYCSNRDRDWDEKEPEFKVEVLDADATVDGKNPFGRLTHAQIKIRAPLFPCTVQKTAVRLPGETSVLDYFRPDVELCIVTKPGPSGPSTYPARKDTLLCMAEPPPYQDVDHDALSGDSGEQTSALLLYIGSGGSSNGPDSRER